MQEKEIQSDEACKEFIRRPYAFFHDGYKGYGGAIAGLIFSYSNSKNRPNAALAASQTEIAERVGCCRSTVGRHIAKLKKLEGFTQITLSKSGRRLPCAVYTYKPSGDTTAFMTTDMRLYGEKEMCPTTVDVFSHILTQYENPKNGINVFYGTPSSIASALHIHTNTARKALRELYRLKYVFRKETVVNGYGTNRYIIPDKVLRRFRTPFMRAEGEPEKANNPYVARKEEIRAADQRAEREHYYAVINQEKERRDDRIRERLLADAEYAAAEKESKKLEIDIPKAELYGGSDEELRGLYKRKEELESKKKGIKRRLRIHELKYKPRCRRCSDTGTTSDRRLCNCWQKYKK